MIFKEALGAVQRFVAGAPQLPEETRAAVDTLETWSALASYLGQLHDALEALDKASGTSGEPGGFFEFYERGLARIREYARVQAAKA